MHAMSRRRLMAASAAGLSALSAACATSSAQQPAPAAPPAPATPPTAPASPPAVPPPVSADQVHGAEALAQVSYTDAERTQLISSISDQLEAIRALRALAKPNDLQPAHVFDPRLPGVTYAPQARSFALGQANAGALPSSDDDIAFAPAWKLSRWLHARAITSRRLTDIYLARIERYGPRLQNFITVMADRARSGADAADREIAAGRIRSPLHGVPYGLKDLFDAAGAPTTWGAEPYANRGVVQTDSIVAARLKEAGAVLLGKTATGALAFGDIWYDGVCKNPWNPEEGSSGSSAGSASGTAAGMMGFGIGTETLGSVVSPSHRCGTTGLRPTFGRTPRTGAMALCWSLDKVGVLARCVLDTAMVLSVIQGGDPSDAASLNHGFAYGGGMDARGMRVGYDPAWFERADPFDRAALEAARATGATLVEHTMPTQPINVLGQALVVEAASAFEEITLTNTDDQLDWQEDAAWPNTFRRTRFISGIDYLQVDRIRRKVMRETHASFEGFDAIIGPNFAGGMLLITNFTGHPQLAFRSGYIDSPARGTRGIIPGSTPHRVPRATSLWAPLFEERKLIRLGRAIEAQLGVAEERPPLT